MRLVNAAVAHAEVACLNDDRDTEWLQVFLNAVSDLRRQLLLYLQSLRINLDDFRQFGKPDHASTWDVGHMRLADKGHHVMLAVAVHIDSGEQDHLVVALDLRKGARQFFRRIHCVSDKVLPQRERDAARCVDKPLPRRILSDVSQECTDMLKCAGGFCVEWGIAIHTSKMIGSKPMADSTTQHHAPSASVHSKGSMIKKIAFGGAILVMASVVMALLFLDAVAARIVSTAGTRVLGVSTSVRSVHLGLMSGSSSLNGLLVAQPPGYSGDPMLSVERVEVRAGLGELISDDIVIDQIAIDGVAVDLSEVNGRINLQVVADNILAAGKAPESDPAAPAAPSKSSVTVRELRITGIKVKARLDNALASGKVLDATIPDIVVQDIGTKTTIDEVSARISAKLMDHLIVAIAQAQIEGLPTSFSNGLQSAASRLGGVLETSESAIGEGLQKVGDAFKSIFDGSGK